MSKLEGVVSDHVSMLNVTNSRIDNVVEALSHTHARLDSMDKFLGILNRTVKDLRRGQSLATFFHLWFPVLAGRVNDLTLAVQSMVLESTTFLQGVRDLTRGELSHGLVPAAMMDVALENITVYLRERLPHYRVAFPSISYYYDNSDPVFSRNKGSLDIVIRIPLTAHQHLFRIYHVYSLPMPIRFYNESRIDATIVEGLPREFAVSVDLSFSIVLTDHDWRGCSGDEVKTCPNLWTYRYLRPDDCMNALYLDSGSDILKYCQFSYVMRASFPDTFAYLGKGLAIVNSMSTTLQVICRSIPAETLDIAQLVLIELGCDCAMRTDTSWVPYQLHGCDSVESVTEVKYPLNTLLLDSMDLRILQDDQEGMDHMLDMPWLISDPIPDEERFKDKDFRVKDQNLKVSFKV